MYKKIIRLGLAIAVIIALVVAVRAYFSPYQTCLRSMPHDPQAPLTAKQQCTLATAD